MTVNDLENLPLPFMVLSEYTAAEREQLIRLLKEHFPPIELGQEILTQENPNE